ncbi:MULTISPECIES: carbohydrate ABC transporter permease [unclassified Enterococcus]|uniref:carbohydrate ABC transporter permease n=1 Tax=unclassified Enterococcus TaxID=2608891 RepID=UPI003B632F3B
MKPTMMVTILFRIISSLRVYDLIVAMTNGGPGGSTETVSMYAIKTYFNYGNIGYGSALSIIMLIVAIMISMIFSGSLKTRLE